jgi:hypothetical protein
VIEAEALRTSRRDNLLFLIAIPPSVVDLLFRFADEHDPGSSRTCSP